MSTTTPANIPAERGLLGSILIDPSQLDNVATIVKASDFFREGHGYLYQVCLDLHDRNTPIDFITTYDLLEEKGQIETLGGAAYLTGLIADTPTSMHAKTYAYAIEKASTQRNIITLASQLAKLGFDDSPGKTSTQLILAAQQTALKALNVNLERAGIVTLAQSLEELFKELDQMAKNPTKGIGIPTGFYLLDLILGGLQKGDLIYMGARPGMGKTSLALCMALNAALRHQKRVLFFSLEMSHMQLSTRLLSMQTGVDSHRIRLGQIQDEELPIMFEHANILTRAQIFLDDEPGQSIWSMKAKIRQMINTDGIDMVFIDYMGLMHMPIGKGAAENRQQAISEVSRAMKNMAREFQIPVICLTQLSRDLEKRADKRPQLSDLRDSGSLEQDADVVLFIYRDDKYNEDSEKQNIADILIAKHRHGDTGEVSLFFRAELTQFRDLEIRRTDLTHWDEMPSEPPHANTTVELYNAELYDK